MRKKEIGNATLILADAFVEMPKLGDVDVIITDPPYNPKTHKGARATKHGRSVALIDFDSLTEQQFIDRIDISSTKAYVSSILNRYRKKISAS